MPIQSLEGQLAEEAAEAAKSPPQRVKIVDIDVPLGSLVWLQVKIIIAGIPIAIGLAALYFFVRVMAGAL